MSDSDSLRSLAARGPKAHATPAPPVGPAPRVGPTLAEEEAWNLAQKKGRLSYSMMFALFVTALFVNTDMFVGGFVAFVGNAVRPDGQTNVKGSIVQALVLVVLFVVVLEAHVQGVV